MITTFDPEELEALRRADEQARARARQGAESGPDGHGGHPRPSGSPEARGGHSGASAGHPRGGPPAPPVTDATVTRLREIGLRLAATAPVVEDEPTKIQPLPTRTEWLTTRTIPVGRFVRLESPELAARVKRPTAYAQTRQAVGQPWVVWRGDSGRGKTSLACAALISAIERGIARRPAFASAWRLSVARSRHPLGEGEPPLVEQALSADLLVLDDLGSEPANPSSAVPDVIFDREERQAATWVTTWMTADAVSKRYGEGIARRIFERATVIEC